MQYFGTFETKYEEVFLTSSYLYFNNDEDDILTPKGLEEKIKNKKLKKKNIIGTIYLYNPIVTPIGYDSNKFLLDQDFEDFEQTVEIKVENYLTTFKQAMRENCKGKIVEIKNLFNLVEKNIDASSLLIKFNGDLEKYYSTQNTEFQRDIMYLDAQETIPNGKFVFFCWGDKIRDKEFPYINDYAKTLYENVLKLGKNEVFVYKEEKTKQESINSLQFSNPEQNPKNKAKIVAAIKKAFKTFPPTSTSY
ncbi:MAG: hypothetical protein ACQERD_11080 [Campylobacterota bacterium]